MNRKKESNFAAFTYDAPEVWYERQLKIGSSEKGSNVKFAEVDSATISKEQLDPSVFTLDYLIENNMTIDPSSTSGILNATDIADQQDQADRQATEIMHNVDNFAKSE